MDGRVTINGEKINWQTTFNGSLYFECEKCGYCCTATNVHLFKQDIEQIAELGYSGFYEPSQAGFRIKGTRTKKCLFLDSNNKCKIYENRPFVCREYPFKVVFLNKSTAFIDCLFSCKSIIKSYNREITGCNKTIKDQGRKIQQNALNQLVKDSVQLSERFFDLREEISRTEAELNKKRWESNISELGYLYDLLDLYKSLSPGEAVDFNFFIEKFFAMFKSQIQKEAAYRALELNTDEFYMITYHKNNVMVISKNKKEIMDIKSINRKKFSRGAKDALISYLRHYWDRKATVMDFYFAMKELREKNTGLEASELQREVLKRILLLFQFFILVISEKNNNSEVKRGDVLEAIFCLDSTIFTPMGAILPGIEKRFFAEQL